MREIIDGCQDSFNELYARYRDKLFYFFYRMLGNCENTSNDFLQDIFLKIIEKPEMFNPSQPFNKWIFTVANNMCKNEYRKREIRKNHRVETIILTEAEEPDFHHFEQKDILETAFNAISGMAETSKSVLLLKYRENFSIETISEILEIPAGTVKSRLYNARAELSKILNASEINF